MNACIVKRGENHHDANEHPDCGRVLGGAGEALADFLARRPASGRDALSGARQGPRSEEHTSELQSRLHLVCRLLLEKKKKKKNRSMNDIRTKLSMTTNSS